MQNRTADKRSLLPAPGIRYRSNSNLSWNEIVHQWILSLSSFKENNNEFKSLNRGLPWRNDFRKKGKLKYLVESGKQNLGSMPTSSAIAEAQQDSRSKSTILWNVPNRFRIRWKRSYMAHLRLKTVRPFENWAIFVQGKLTTAKRSFYSI